MQSSSGKVFHGRWYKARTILTGNYSGFQNSSFMRKPNCYSDNCMVIQDPWTPFLLISCLKVLVLVALWRNLHTDCGAGGFWLLVTVRPSLWLSAVYSVEVCCKASLIPTEPSGTQNYKMLSLKQKHPFYSMLWLITHFIFQSHFACFPLPIHHLIKELEGSSCTWWTASPFSMCGPRLDLPLFEV